MEPIDRKFTIRAMCREHAHAHTEADSVLFLAKDRALPATLRFYHEECVRLGVDERQLEGVRLLIERVERFQTEHTEIVKLPDVDPSADWITAPNEVGA